MVVFFLPSIVARSQKEPEQFSHILLHCRFVVDFLQVEEVELSIEPAPAPEPMYEESECSYAPPEERVDRKRQPEELVLLEKLT